MNLLKRLLIANLTLLLPILSWGLPIPFLGDVFQRWDPVLSAALRYVIALPFAWIFWLMTRKAAGPMKPADLPWWPVIKLGVGLMIFSLIYAFALGWMHPVTAAVFSALGPLITATVARFGFGEALPAGFRTAVLLSLVGGILTTVDPTAIDGAWIEIRGGEPLLLLASVLWAWYSLGTARVRPGLDPTQVTLLTLLPACVLLPPIYLLCWWLGVAQAPPPMASWRTDDIVIQLWFSILAIAAATIAWNRGVSLVGAVVSSLYLNLIPIAAIAAAVIAGYEPRPLQYLGMAIVLAGVLQAQLRLVRRVTPPP